jgi:hypothetical protein
MRQYHRVGFTVPVHPTGALAERNGFYQDKVNGERRYITVDDLGRAAVGPRVHRAGRLWPNMKRRHTKQTQETMNQAADHSAETTVIVLDGEEVQDAVIVPEWRDRLRRSGRRLLACLRDKEWHETARQNAVTLFTYLTLGSVAAVFLKGAWWVVTL